MNWVSAALGAVMMAAVAFSLHTVDMYFVDKSHAKELSDTKIQLAAQCESQKAITEKVDNEYTQKISTLNGRLADARRLYGNACLAVAGNAASGNDGATGTGKRSGQSIEGYRIIPVQTYIDYAAEGEKYRIQLLACQDFVRLTEPPKTGQKKPK